MVLGTFVVVVKHWEKSCTILIVYIKTDILYVLMRVPNIILTLGCEKLE